MRRSRSWGTKGRTSTREDDEAATTGRGRTDERHPASELNRRVGNRAIQRLAAKRDGGEHESRVDGPPDGSTGRPLAGETRRAMERAFGADFGDVRVHDGVGALTATRALDAAAYATDSDVVFGPDATLAGTEAAVLAHELAHVAQFEQSGGGDGRHAVTRRGEAAEREAATAAERATRGETIRPRESPSAPVATLGFGWLEEGAEAIGSAASSVGSAVKSGASTVGSAVSSGASAAWEGAKDVGSSVASGASSAASWVGDAASTAYGGMKAASGAIMQGGKWLEGKIDAGQDWLSGKVQSAADMAEGIPVLEQVADAGSWAFDQATGLGAGVLQGATSFGSGLLGMVANPVDAAKGLYEMSTHVPVPGVMHPLRAIDSAVDLASGDASIGDFANRMINPFATMEEDAKFWKNVAGGFASDYERSIGEDADYAQAVGRGVFDIGSLFLGGSGAVAKGGSTAGRVANVASKTSRGSRVARTASTTSKAARGGQTVVDDAIKVSRSGADDVQARITSTADEVMTTQKAMGRQGPVSAGSPWVRHKGQWVRRSGNRWRNKQGQFAEGPYSLAGGASKSSTKSLDDIIKRAESDYQMGAQNAEDFLSVTGKTKSGTPRASEAWRSKYRPGKIEKHHLLPQEFLTVPAVRKRLAQVIKSKKSTPEDFVHRQLAGITKQRHMRLDKAGYAADWAKWFKQNPQFTKGQVEAQIKAMMEAYGIPKGARNWLKKYGRN